MIGRDAGDATFYFAALAAFSLLLGRERRGSFDDLDRAQYSQGMLAAPWSSTFIAHGSPSTPIGCWAKLYHAAIEDAM